MSARDDIMKDYVPVNERIGAFLTKHPDGSLQSELVELSDNRVVMRAYAYRHPEDARPGIGYSSLEIPGRTPYTKGSEVENCETSAWGRAIAALGFEVKRGIASAEEVRNKQNPRMGEVIPADPKPIARPTHDGSLIGVAELAKDFLDFLPKQGPDGMVLAFKLKAQGGIKVIAKGQLAEALVPLRDSIIGQRVSVWGRVRDETFRPKGSTKDVTYAVCDLERIQTADGTLPAPEALPEPPDDVPLVGEAPPLFDDVETVPAA